MFTDSHCHIFDEYYSDIEKVIEDAKDVGVNKFIVASTKVVDALEILEHAKKYNKYYFCLGIHPEEITDNYNLIENMIIENLNNPQFVGIGEIGLDYYYGKESKLEQIELFEKQLALAEKYNLPVVVHSREATLDTLNSIKKFKVRGVMHCFNGSIETANEYLKLGFYFGVNGVMTFKNSKIDEVIKNIPLNRIVLETDSPYLTPEPFRKYHNEPKYIKTIAEYLANLKGIELSEVSRITEENIKQIFTNI